MQIADYGGRHLTIQTKPRRITESQAPVSELLQANMQHFRFLVET